jgi:hypothetical protein
MGAKTICWTCAGGVKKLRIAELRIADWPNFWRADGISSVAPTKFAIRNPKFRNFRWPVRGAFCALGSEDSNSTAFPAFADVGDF